MDAASYPITERQRLFWGANVPHHTLLGERLRQSDAAGVAKPSPEMGSQIATREERALLCVHRK